jgi:hypothetical protein
VCAQLYGCIITPRERCENQIQISLRPGRDSNLRSLIKRADTLSKRERERERERESERITCMY